MHPRGGYELDMQWKDGKLTQAVLRGISNKPGKVQVRYGNTTGTFEIVQGGKKILAAEHFGGMQRDERFLLIDGLTMYLGGVLAQEPALINP